MCSNLQISDEEAIECFKAAIEAGVVQIIYDQLIH